MFGRVLSALFSFGGWLAKPIMAKFFLFFGLWFLTNEFMLVVVNYLPAMSDANSAFHMADSRFFYVWNLFALDYGLPTIISAMATRFVIRRLPVIG